MSRFPLASRAPVAPVVPAGPEVLTDSSLITFRLKAGGKALPSHFEVRGLHVTREVNRIPSARIVLLDGDVAKRDFPASAEPMLQPGQEIEILAGYQSKDESIFKGIITRLRIRAPNRGASELILECKDRCVSLTATRKSACFIDKTDQAVMEELIKGAGLSVKGDPTSVTHGDLVQFHATDWDFIVSRAEANGRLVLVKDGEVRIEEPKTTAEPALVLDFGVNLFEFEAQLEQSAIKDSGDSSAGSWDAKTQKSESSGTGTKLQLRHGGSRSAAELKAWAAAAGARASLATVRGRAQVQGNARLLPGQVVTLKGMGKTFSGKNLFVSGVAHEILNGEWLTDVQFGLAPEWFHQRPDVTQAAAGGLLPAVAGLQIGIVTKITEDPQNEFRVQVRLPLVDAVGEGVWARMARFDAGRERGAVFLPEVDDEVVLGFLDGDPRDVIVLGMLHSSAHPSPFPGEEKNMLKGIVTREKLKLTFDDKRKVITISTPKGNCVVLDEEGEKLTITDQNNNQVEMSSAGLKLAGKGHTIELGDSSVKVTSGKDLVLEATGNVVIKGTLVQVN